MKFSSQEVNYVWLDSFKSFSNTESSMSNDQRLTSPLKSKYVLITDPKILEKIKAEEEELISLNWYAVMQKPKEA